MAVLWLFSLLAGGCSEKVRVEKPENEAPTGMVWIPGGKFRMGGPSAEVCRTLLAQADAAKPCCPLLQQGFGDAQPVHEVEIEGFWMDEAEVTNGQFRKFVGRDRLCDRGRTKTEGG